MKTLEEMWKQFESEGHGKLTREGLLAVRGVFYAGAGLMLTEISGAVAHGMESRELLENCSPLLDELRDFMKQTIQRAAQRN